MLFAAQDDLVGALLAIARESAAGGQVPSCILTELTAATTYHCPNCNRAITALLTRRLQTGAPDKDEYLALLGALGGLVGLALATTSEGGD